MIQYGHTILCVMFIFNALTGWSSEKSAACSLRSNQPTQINLEMAAKMVTYVMCAVKPMDSVFSLMLG